MSPTAVIRPIATASPPHRYAQPDLLALTGYTGRLARQFFANAGIEHRAFTHPVEPLVEREPSHEELHARFVEGAMALGEQAAREALRRAGRTPTDIDLLVVATCTGYVCPSLASRLAGVLNVRQDLQRCDVVGLGCGAALSALQRAADHVRAQPGRRTLVVATEVCSATYFEDGSAETALANALFADGAAACVVEAADEADSDAASGPRIVDFQSHLDPQHIHYMGYKNVGGKLRIMIDRDIRRDGPRLAREMVERLLERNGLKREEVSHWVLHSGGSRVVEGMVQALGLDPEAARHAREVLRDHGNMSSPTILFVLERLSAHDRPAPGEYGVMVALGPGFAAEGALLRW